jgi:hypothetical protein
VCSDGQWLVDQAVCADPVCPDVVPEAGDSCACERDLQCVYDQCGDASERTLARCGGDGKWTQSSSACGTATFACGPSTCVEGQICVTTIAPGPTLLYRCTDENPCAGEVGVQCACAESLCEGKLCSDTPGPNILCGGV